MFQHTTISIAMKYMNIYYAWDKLAECTKHELFMYANKKKIQIFKCFTSYIHAIMVYISI